MGTKPQDKHFNIDLNWMSGNTTDESVPKHTGKITIRVNLCNKLTASDLTVSGQIGVGILPQQIQVTGG
jgi:hypothetical protein